MTDRADINSVLSEIRSMRAQMLQSQRITQDQTQNLDKVATPGDTLAPSFNDMFSQAVNNVNSLQKESSQLATAYEQGDPDIDITRVMIASQKSSVAFEAMTQVRNRVVRAYEDIMNMPV